MELSKPNDGRRRAVVFAGADLAEAAATLAIRSLRTARLTFSHQSSPRRGGRSHANALSDALRTRYPNLDEILDEDEYSPAAAHHGDQLVRRTGFA